MDKDKINMLVKNCREQLQLKQHAMKFKDATVYYQNGEFSAKIKVTQKEIIVIPQDVAIDAYVFTESHLNGVQGLASKEKPLSRAIIIRPKDPNKLTCEIKFKTMGQRDRALAAIGALISASTTDESNGEEEEDVGAN